MDVGAGVGRSVGTGVAVGTDEGTGVGVAAIESAAVGSAEDGGITTFSSDCASGALPLPPYIWA
jgi:hypothetical protein